MRMIKGAALALLVGLSAGATAAGPTYYYNKITYYSDATKTVIVGREYDLCSGETLVQGVQTDHTTIVQGDCPYDG